jgi:hypothetical protein
MLLLVLLLLRFGIECVVHVVSNGTEQGKCVDTKQQKNNNEVSPVQ